MSKNSIKFSLLNSEQRDSWLNSSHRTLDADTIEFSLSNADKGAVGFILAQELAILTDEQRTIFNSNQATAFDAVLESVTNNQGYLFFIHTAGGCGKTFLCNTIAAEVRRRGQIALCVASSGIAALLLDRERTSHSCFKIPLSIHEDSVARLKRNSYIFPIL